MQSFNGNKKLSIEIYLNCPSGVMGYTIWHVWGGRRKAAMSRNADGKDFDWMTDAELKKFENGEYKFKITAQDALDTFGYMY